jgi:hypothetical protein
MKGAVTLELSSPQGCGRILACLTYFWSHEPRLSPHEESDIGKSMHVLLDGKPIAQLDWIDDDQPSHIYRLTLIDTDRSKTEFALKTDENLQSEMLKAERVLIQDRYSGWIKVPWLYLTAIYWERGTVYIRDACRFEPPPREPLPEDEIPGWGSVADAHKLIQETMRLDRLEYDRAKGRQSL